MPDGPQVNIFAICDRVVRDQWGKPSLLGIFNTLNLPNFPTVFSFFSFTQIIAQGGNYRLTIHFSREKGLPQTLFDGAIQVNEQTGAADFVANLSLTFESPGLYEFRLYIDDIPRLMRPFHVRKAR